MADIVKWNPFEDMVRFRDEFNRFFSGLSPWGDHGRMDWSGGWGPSVDVRETDNEVEVSVEVPGINPGDLDLTVGEDSLTIRGEVKHAADENKQGYRRIERRYGAFQRTIPLPAAVQHSKAKADYKDGILQVVIPKAELSQARVTRLKLDNGPKQLQ